MVTRNNAGPHKVDDLGMLDVVCPSENAWFPARKGSRQICVEGYVIQEPKVS